MAAPNEPVRFEFEHADRLAIAFRAAPAEMKKALRKSNADLGRKASAGVRAAAATGTRQQARMARGIGFSTSATSVSIRVRNTSSAPGAAGAFYGAKFRKQFPRPWAGTGWVVGGSGGPRVLNPWVRDHKAQAERDFLDGQVVAVARVLDGKR
jgi:hypothetical protein